MKNIWALIGMIVIFSLIFAACSGGTPTEEINAIDISNPDILDEYLDFCGSATPSDYSSQAEAFALNPFTQTLTLEFKDAPNTKFSVAFNGDDYTVDSGELAIDITGVDSGMYPVTITTQAKANQIRAQAQIWVQIDNGIIIPTIDLKWLEKDTATFSFTRDSDKTQPATVSIYLRTQDGSNGTKKTEVLLPANTETEVVLTGLSEEQSYEIGIRRNGEQETNWLASFRTFKSFEEGLQLFYWLDLTKPETHKVGVKIFGFYKGLDEVYLDNHEGGYANGENFSLISEPENEGFDFRDSQREVYFDFGGSQEGYFLFSYDSNKEYLDIGVGNARGYFGEDYLMTVHEQLLYGPAKMLSEKYGELANRKGSFDLHLFLKINEGWNYSTGWEEQALEINGFPEFYINDFWAYFKLACIYAYKESEFYLKKITHNSENTEFIFIITKEAGNDFDDICDDILLLYDQLIDIWDKEMYVPKYTVMKTKALTDDNKHMVFGGEGNTGQGYSNENGYVNLVVAHCLYHIWNGWALGLPWDHRENQNWGFWSEGFNEFYCGKIFSDLEFKTIDVEQMFGGLFPLVSRHYRDYSEYRGTDDDKNLITGNHTTDHTTNSNANSLHYNKGSVYAYVMENEIKERTNNTKSLDNVLKHLWDQYDADETPGSYSEILDFLRDEVPGGMDDWWQAYLLNNEPVYLYEFEENPPPFSVVNPAPENREEAINKNITLSWEVDNPDNKTLQYDLYIQKLYRDEQESMEPTYPELETTSKTLTLENEMKYIWRVKAYDNEGNEYITPVWFFETE